MQCHLLVKSKECDDLKLEKKLVTHSCERGVHMIIFGFSVVDNYNVAKKSLAYE